MSRFLIHSTPELTGKGETGAVLLGGGPVAGALSYWWLVHTEATNLAATDVAPTYDFWHPASDAMPIVAIIASVAATSIGLVLILTGRTHRHEVEVVSEK